MPNYIELGFDDFIERRITGDAPDVSSLEPSGGSVMGLTGDFGTPSNGSTLINSGNSSQFIGEQALEFDRLRVVIGQDTNTVGMSGEGAESTSIRIWAGESFTNRTSAPFRVDAAGNVTATSITITGGSVGGWTITATTLYGLASGTPSAVPSDGIVMTSGATANITIYEDTEARVVVGNLSAGVYGLRGYDTDGVTTLFELSDTQNIIAGWVITDGYIYNLQSGTPTAAPNDGIVMASGNEGLIVYEDTAERVRVGYISAGVYGVRGFATNGTDVVFEFSDTRQVIGGWNFTDTVLRTGATDAASNVLIDSANSLMRLGPTTGDSITIDGANQRIRSSNYVTGVTGFTVEPGLVEAQNILARGTMSGTVFRYDVISATGGRQIIANADALSTAMTALDASTLITRGNVTLAVNDILIIRAQNSSGIQEEYLRVTGIGAAPTYTVTRDLAATYGADANPAWPAGTVVVQQGVSDGAAAFSGGWLELVGEASSGSDWPRISVFQRTAVAYNGFTERVRIGNLNGYLGYVADTFGVGIGSSAAGDGNITIDPTNGIRIRTATTNKFVVDNSGNAYFASAITVGDGATTSGTVTLNHFGTGGDTYFAGGTITAAAWTAQSGFILGIDDSDGDAIKFYFGDSSVGQFVDYNVTIANRVTVNGIQVGTVGFFGGDGSDGALAVAADTTTLDLSNSQVVIFNYTSISISAGATLAFSNPHTNGTIIILKSQTNVTIEGTINASGIGAAGGNGASGQIGAKSDGNNGSNGTNIDDSDTRGGLGEGGNDAAAGPAGAGGAAITSATDFTNTLLELVENRIRLLAGSGGGGGGAGYSNAAGVSGGNGGAGGRGGGGLAIFCAGLLDFDVGGTINISGADGVNGSQSSPTDNAAGGGGGGGGGAGSCVVLYNELTDNSGTITAAGGAAGNGANCDSGGSQPNDYGGGGGGAGAGNTGGAGAAGGAGGVGTGGNGNNGTNGGAGGRGAGGGGGASTGDSAAHTGGTGGTGGSSSSNNYFVSENNVFA